MISLVETYRERDGRIALIDLRTGAVIDYAGLASLVLRAAAWLRAIGLKPGDTLVQRLPNCPEALVLFLACLEQGLDCAPLSPHAPSEEAEHWLRLTDARLTVISRLQADAAAELLMAGGQTVRIDTDGRFNWLPDVAKAVGPGEPGRLLIRTSGSSGDPKVVVQSAEALRACARVFGERVGVFDADSRVFAAAPLWSLSGLFNVGLVPLELGAGVVLGEAVAAISAAKLWHDVSRSHANVIWPAPSAMRLLTRTPPSRALRGALVGMAPSTSQEKADFAAAIGAPVYENYGLTETLFITSQGPDAPGEGVGSPLEGVTLAFAPPIAEGSGELDDSTSEVCVDTPFLFRGYLQTDGSLAPPPLDGRGFLRTADLGGLEPDGGLRVGGRIRAVVKRSGQPIFLPEIESIARTIAGVADAAAIPTAHKVFVESYILLLQPSDRARGAALADEVRFALAARLAREFWPDDIKVASEDFPLLANGKPDYQALRAALGVIGASPVRGG